MQALDGHVELVAVGVLEMEEFPFDAAGLERDKTEVTPDTVFRMDDG